MTLARQAGGVLVGLLVFLGTGEVAARVALSSPDFVRQAASGTADARRVATIARAVQLGRIPFFDHNVVVFDPQLGQRNAPMDATLERAEVTAHYRVDAQGLRATAPVGWQPDPGAAVIALVGDSFTFGDEVSDEATAAWGLRERTGAVVQNRGVLGHGLDQILLQWRAELADAPPDVLVLLLTNVVAFRSGAAWDNWARPWIEATPEGLAVRGVPVPPPDSFLPAWWSPRLDDVVTLWRAQATMHTDLDRALTLAPRLLTALADETRAAQTTLAVVYAPVPSEVEGPDAAASAVHDAVFVPWCEQARGPLCVDLLDAFRAAAEEGVDLTEVRHWSAEGHALVADVLAEVLDEEGLLGEAAGEEGED
ncbi:MAG: hypothetical protein H6732_17835 [Alphaproteobacteria bacterium]|nr:hypothetical protein [Alphaproteobacteria bacterium]